MKGSKTWPPGQVMGLVRTTVCLACLVMPAGCAVLAEAVEPEGVAARFAAGGWPDRIVLTPGADAAREMAVAFRSDLRQGETLAEIARLDDEADIRRVAGESSLLETENGPARYHNIRFEGLRPDTVYRYRLRGAEGWSEWFQFRTAADEFQPFRFLYFGDIQTEILDAGAPLVRAAFRAVAEPAFAVHAGDLVNQDEGDRHDDEWGAWAAVGGPLYAEVPQFPVIGNHEYIVGETGRAPAPQWEKQFVLPDNGAPGLETRSYVVDYQGLRFVALDGTAALHLDGLDGQTDWLREVLSEGAPHWTVVSVHQPLYSCGREAHAETLIEAWEPLFVSGGVDLVLQGHDHCYARFDGPASGGTAPVYVVSVAGAKMYSLSEQAVERAAFALADTQLYQVVEVGDERLELQAFDSAGRLVDSVTITRSDD